MIEKCKACGRPQEEIEYVKYSYNLLLEPICKRCLLLTLTLMYNKGYLKYHSYKYNGQWITDIHDVIPKNVNLTGR